MSRPLPERAGDVLPTPEDFAGWPPLGGLSREVAVGPVLVALHRIESRLADALADFPPCPPAGAEALRVRLEWTRASRPAWLELQAADRARSVAWRESGALAFATHHAALLMDAEAERGLVVVTDQDADSLARTAQNVLRVAAAWRLAAAGRGLLVHAAAVRRDDDSAVVFLGPSGAGKSTAARLSAPRPVLADDACVLTCDGGRARLWPAPLWAEAGFPGRDDAAEPIDVAILLRLRQADAARVTLLTRAAAVATLAAHAPFFAGLEGGLDPVDVASRLAGSTPVAEMEFARDPAFWTELDSNLSRLAGPARQARSQS